jgi:hypothetical protein
MSQEENVSSPKEEETISSPESPTRQLTEIEKNSLPFEFKKPYAYEDNEDIIYAEWHKKPVYSKNLEDWYFNALTKSENDDTRISATH